MNSDYLDISSKDIILFGRIVKRYKMSVEDIDDLNEKYETVKKQLGSYGTRLAGRLKSELNFTKILFFHFGFLGFNDASGVPEGVAGRNGAENWRLLRVMVVGTLRVKGLVM